MATPLRVAYTLEQCWHRVPGGTATSALELARALVDRDDVDLIGVAAAHRNPPPAAFRPTVAVEHLRVPRRMLYELWHRTSWPAVTRATGPVDVVHGTGGATPPRGATPLVVTVHDLAVLHHPDFFTTNGRLFLRAAIDTARRRADVVVCPSQAVVDDCVANGFDPDRTVRVAHGVDVVPVSAADADEVRRRYGLDDRFVLFVGTQEPRKNLSTLLAAMEQLEESVPLVLAGPEGWGATTQWPAAVDVRAVGFVPAGDLRALYRAATVFCYPSLLEGFGLPVLEAMARSTPVVTSRGTATEELVGDGGVLVDPKRADDVAAGLQRVLAHPDPVAQWGEAGAAIAATYTWARAAEQTVGAYRRAIEVSS
ncbi:MAG: glycosyltransferase family 4 protein [Acidimicrobiales bacterium]